MAIQIAMDRTGDSRHLFDPNDALELARAERQPGFELKRRDQATASQDSTKSANARAFALTNLPVGYTAHRSIFGNCQS